MKYDEQVTRLSNRTDIHNCCVAQYHGQQILVKSMDNAIASIPDKEIRLIKKELDAIQWIAGRQHEEPVRNELILRGLKMYYDYQAIEIFVEQQYDKSLDYPNHTKLEIENGLGVMELLRTSGNVKVFITDSHVDMRAESYDINNQQYIEDVKIRMGW